ncbi:Lauroyl/myristoyl acyltransferase [Actinoalloteichus sp. GBA129-24]|uniref:Lauroyl/myristoyl acyltransferase n=1 Tax=Actinoalloteichus fjordicus TaxID=1612552 RepID=A0AAC9LC61_9PSEU|nr:Lauroyl/myristoyl acyltransferase [Actinoalloteichus fjordicus]APU20183.1 Lauroyl/myristoyl acyltransferase [Actinoalloteichus sp. GBA129-24]
MSGPADGSSTHSTHSLRERLVDGAYTAGWRLVRLLPERAARLLFQAGADLAVRRGGRGIDQLRRNLRRVAPELTEAGLDDLVRRSMRSYLRYWREAFRLPAMDLRTVSARVDAGVVGREHLDAALAQGRGAIAVLPHSGNWDIAGVWAVSRYGGFTSVVERLRPEPLYRRFVAYRESMGFEILPHDGGRQMMSTLLTRLRENRLLCLIADRDLSRRGVEVQFFGETTRMASGPARLAAATGAVLVPAACEFTDDGWAIRLYEPVPVTGASPAEVQAATQQVADVFAADIAARPEDWHMMQPLWLADLSARRRAILAEDAATTGAASADAAAGTTGPSAGPVAGEGVAGDTARAEKPEEPTDSADREDSVDHESGPGGEADETSARRERPGSGTGAGSDLAVPADAAAESEASRAAGTPHTAGHPDAAAGSIEAPSPAHEQPTGRDRAEPPS